jgi:hypothetical protein
VPGPRPALRRDDRRRWKGGKSTLAVDLFRCRETGDQLFGRWWVEPGPTLLVTEETGVAVDYKTAGLQKLALIDRSAARGHIFAEVLERLRQWAVDSGGGVIVIESGIQPRRPGPHRMEPSTNTRSLTWP